MTKDLLQRYADICEELHDIEKTGRSDYILSSEKADRKSTRLNSSHQD